MWDSNEQPTVVGSFCQPETALSDFSSSYPAFCRAVLPRLSPPSFRTRWLQEGHSLPAVLYMSLAALSWRRTLLIHDPENFVSHWLRTWKGNQLMVVDYRERLASQCLSIQMATPPLQNRIPHLHRNSAPIFLLWLCTHSYPRVI